MKTSPILTTRPSWALGVALVTIAPVGCELHTASSQRPEHRHFPRPRVTHVETASMVGSRDATAAPRVFSARHDRVRRSLAESDVTKVKLGRSGRSIAFKITLADGTEGYFKPEQTFAAHWYSELAAYHVDRALGLGRVPPAIGRRFRWSRLREAAKGDPHADEVVIGPDGTVRGAFMWWVPAKVVPVDLPEGWESWLAVDRPPAVSPFQRRSGFQRARARANKASGAANGEAQGAPAPDRAGRPAELADLILFDFLIGNSDRWGGNFTNVRTRGRNGPVVYIDNANGFHAGRKPTPQDEAKLAAVQRMRRATVDAIHALDIEALRAALAKDPLAPILSKRHFDDLRRRRRAILEHVKRMRAEHGQKAMPW